MKYNINKIVVMFACAFVIIFASTHSCLAEDNAVQNASEVNPEIADTNLGDEVFAIEQTAEEAPATAEAPVVEEAEVVIEETPAVSEPEVTEEDVVISEDSQNPSEVSENDVDFLNEDVPDEVSDNPSKTPEQPLVAPQSDIVEPTAKQMEAPKANTLLDVQPFPDNEDNLNALETDVNKAQIDSTADVDAVIPEIGEAKSPFESFGNAILARVDNDLFNQMSNIEKQTTLLRLELRREELKTRVEALRNARIKAQQEEDARIRAEEERAKDVENERQAKIIAEQEKLKEKEIELEKVRQAKVVNDYMNEMLLVNQQWVAKNSELQRRVHELEEEMQKMSQEYHVKLSDIRAEISTLIPRAEKAVNVFKRKMEALNGHINQLKSSMLEREDEIKQLSNPFANDAAPGKDAIDMSREYAIVSITGTGDDVIAKIMSNDGKTFSVHVGSVLKNGEVVTSITDHYISFENEGIQSYLYTGGTIMEYEPVVTFNGSDRTPAQTEKAIVKGDSSNVLGGAEIKTKIPTVTRKNEPPVLIKKPRKTNGNLSFGSGTFVQ